MNQKYLPFIVGGVILLLVLIFFGPFYIIQEGNQAVILRFGEIVATDTTAGLKFKMPIIDQVWLYPAKIMSWDGAEERIQTRENQFIMVDVTARWRIKDPALFYRKVTTLEKAYQALDNNIDALVRTAIANNFLREAVRSSDVLLDLSRNELASEEQTEASDALRQLTSQDESTQMRFEKIEKGRRKIAEEMLAAAKIAMEPFGIEVIDVVIRQIRYSDDLTPSVYARMEKDRSRIANAYRSIGEGRRNEWLGKLENERRSILSAAYEAAERIKGQADATAAQIYSNAYGADRDFFEFWRAIESYRATLPNFKKTLTTDMDYFRYLYDPSGRR